VQKVFVLSDRAGGILARLWEYRAQHIHDFSMVRALSISKAEILFSLNGSILYLESWCNSGLSYGWAFSAMFVFSLQTDKLLLILKMQVLMCQYLNVNDSPLIRLIMNHELL